MTAPAWADRFAARFETAQAVEAYGTLTVDVTPADWLSALEFARDELGCTYFDWLSAVDEAGDGFDVVVHLWRVRSGNDLLIRTRLPAESAALPTATGVFAGAAWHERETAEMFGIDFPGHPHLVPLLLPDGFEGHPLRKDFVLAARAAKPWPGAKEPGESDADHGRRASPGRRKTLPPGVPDPAVWGPRKPGVEPADPGAQPEPPRRVPRRARAEDGPPSAGADE